MFGVDRSYVSDFAQWMQKGLSEHPEWQAGQRASRALWWDGKRDFKAEAASASAEISPKPYPYDVNFRQP